MRVAAAKSGGKGRAAPIKRNSTAFCITPVQALAISPVTFMQFVQGEQLVAFVKHYGTPRNGPMLNHQLREKREWMAYKQQLMAQVLCNSRRRTGTLRA
eukprot:1762927-Prymnesium_polylepis.1